jgi:hypothetical protein
MFGISSFAETPFASLAGAGFVFTLVEGIQSADSSTQQSNYSLSHVENVLLDEIDSTGAIFFANVTESLFSADTSIVIAGYLGSVNEDVTSADSSAIAAQFTSSVTEDATINDAASMVQVFDASIVENMEMAEAQPANLIVLFAITENLSSFDSSTQQFSFLQSIVENSVVADSFGVGGWVKIIDVQTANWVNINNSQ